MSNSPSPVGGVKDPEVNFEVCEFSIPRLKAKCDNLWATIDPLQIVTPFDVTLREEKLKKLREEVSFWERSLTIACSYLKAPDVNFDKYSPFFDESETVLDKVQLKISQMKDFLKHNTVIPKHVRLEPVKLPLFSGKFNEWEEYKDLFVSTVDSNKSLSGAEKLVYLKTSLVGEALSIVCSFPTTDLSYAPAWDLVKARYSNPREIAFSHIRKLDELSKVHDTAQDLRRVVDTLNEVIRSLKNQLIPVEHWDVILVYWTIKKLDMGTRREWLLTESTDLPKLKDLLNFLEHRSQALDDSVSTSSKVQKVPQRSLTQTKSAHFASSTLKNCAECGLSHSLHHCDSFIKKSVPERKEVVKNSKLCYNCLARGHSAQGCVSKFKCKVCQKPHHSLLHSNSIVLKKNTAHCSFGSVVSSQVILETALAEVRDSQGQKVTVRLFVDKGSEVEFITFDCMKKLGLIPKKSSVSVTGLGGVNCGITLGKVKLSLISKLHPFSLPITAQVMSKITHGSLPQVQCHHNFPHLQGLNLADPDYSLPQSIDIIPGARHASRIRKGGIIHGPRGTPSAEETWFGWVISGPAPLTSQNSTSNSCFSSIEGDSDARDRDHYLSRAPTYTPTDHSCEAGEGGDLEASPRFEQVSEVSKPLTFEGQDSSLQDLLVKFWETEEPAKSPTPRSIEDQLCEDSFQSKFTRDAEGRYVVSLPFHKDHQVLGNSVKTAMKRFSSVEGRISKNPFLKSEYNKYFSSNLSKGILEVVPPQEVFCDSAKCYYMPYREVVKESSSSTKVRIVFDCSAKTQRGNSLNDILYSGPKLQVDLVPLLIRFRKFPIALSADIVKFFTQIGVDKSHQDFQRLVYRKTPDVPFTHFRMTRLTFGLTSAPFLAIRSLNQLFQDECYDPVLQKVIKEDTLVDNILTGCFTVAEALALQEKLCKIMLKGQFQLKKWASNAHQLILSIPPEDRELEFPLNITENHGLPTLGLNWNPIADHFTMVLPRVGNLPHPTKRQVLSFIARIFDPLGWLSPVTIRAKIFLQELWKLKLDWDTPLLSPQSKKWTLIREEILLLNKFTIKRCYLDNSVNWNPENTNFELFGFSDASNYAFASVVYLRSMNTSGVKSISLVAAKTKVASVKGDTTPRLEFQGARLLTTLIKVVRDSLNLKINSLVCFSDSMSVIGWLNSSQSKDKKRDVYIQNRVSFIKSTLPEAHWIHVNGSDNPADCASRGISSSQFLNTDYWRNGPTWLIDFSSPRSYQVQSSENHPSEDSPFLKIIMCRSTVLKMQRITAYVIRFVGILKSRGAVLFPRFLTSEELNNSLQLLVRTVQKSVFSSEINQLDSHKNESPKKLKFLSPFIDQHGLLRVGGRLQKSEIAHHSKHPLLLPKNHHFSTVVARDYHITHQHAGPTLLLSLLREKFWPVSGPTLVKRVVRSCVKCHRHSPRPLHQIMAELPLARVSYTRPFLNTGMDFAGPFSIVAVPGRKPKLLKSYVCVFVCMAVKAVHFELVGDLSSLSFISALKRFSSRRGLPQALFSDGGKNFVGAKSELDHICDFLTSAQFNEDLGKYCSTSGIKFKFNPPLSPHHGGLFEAAVKSVKFHLKRVLNDRHISIEEMTTVLCQIEGTLNSRPLVPLSCDPSDISALTPAHFLVGGPLHSVPEEHLIHKNLPPLKRWIIAQQIGQEVSRRFHHEYLQILQSRPKWLNNQPNIEPGTLVLVKESDAAFSSHKWNLARVTQVFFGSDGQVRVVEVKTPTGSLLRRPIVKISPLPLA